MIRIGIIGCGHITEKHVKTLLQLNDISITAISDISKYRMMHIKQLTGRQDIPVYTDYEKLLQIKEIDLILVAVSTGQHAEIARKALLHHKHVLVEKPLTLSLKTARDLITLADSQNRHLFVCYQLRHRIIMHKLKELIDSGRLGKIHCGSITMDINRDLAYFGQSAWRGTWEQDGGMLLNQGIHLIDLLLWFMGDIKSVYGDMINIHRQKETEDAALGILSFQNGAKGSLEANIITQPASFGYSIRLFAEYGSIIISGKNLENIELYSVQGEEEPNLLEWKEDNLEHVRMYQSISSKINGAQISDAVTAEASMKALEAIFAFYASVLQQEKVPLPLTGFSTENMAAWSKDH